MKSVIISDRDLEIIFAGHTVLAPPQLLFDVDSNTTFLTVTGTDDIRFFLLCPETAAGRPGVLPVGSGLLIITESSTAEVYANGFTTTIVSRSRLTVPRLWTNGPARGGLGHAVTFNCRVVLWAETVGSGQVAAQF